MIVGFLGHQIQVLKTLKHTVGDFPEFAYVAYIDTQTDAASEEQMRAAAKWLQQKGVAVVGVGKGVPGTLLASLEVPVVPVSELASFLQEKKQAGSRGGTTREIYITQNSKEQDQAIAQILGGVFVEE